MNIIKICEHCKKEFTIPFKQRNKKYCNQTCYVSAGIKGKPKQVDLYEKRKCLNCEKEFEIRKKQQNKICSDECRLIWNKKNSQERCKKSIESSKLKNNGFYYFQTDDFKTKSDQTKIKRYGTKNHMEVPEIRKKFFDSISKITEEQQKEIIKKRNETKFIKYGDANYNNRDKFNETLNERYGGHHLKLEEFQNKSKKTHFDHYGVEFPLQIKSNQDKAINKQKELFDGLYVSSDEYKEKVIKQRYNSVIKRIEDRGFIFIDYVDDKYATIKCKKCGNEFTHTQVFREYDIICRKCYPITSDNSLNIFMESIFDDNNINYLKNDKKLLNRKEVDYVLPSYNIGFEINGNYYHSEIYGKKDKNYHIDKTKKLNVIGIKLIHIFEDEIKKSPNIVFSRIKNILNITENKIFARKCIIKEISKSESKIFLEKNHLQGDLVDKIRTGLFFNNELVSVMTFGMKRKSLGNTSMNNEYELLRFASKLDTNVIGGFSRLLKYFIKEYQPFKIITYADSRWSGIIPEETIYYKCGFKFIHQSDPNYWYVSTKDFLHRFHRFTFRKDKLVKEGFSKDKTEWEIMQERGFDRIWDCGTMKFEMIL
jgi:very-short-patch-repair endonuclease